MYRPLARPITNLPAYKPPIDVVVIITTFETIQRIHATQILAFRPMKFAIGPARKSINTIDKSIQSVIPAAEEAIKAPNIIKDEISCWRVGEMLYPRGVVGSSLPNTWVKSESRCSQLRRILT